MKEDYLDVNVNMLALIMRSFYDYLGTRNRNDTEFTAVFRSNHMNALEQLLVENELTDYYEHGYLDKKDKFTTEVTKRPVVLINLSFAETSVNVLKIVTEIHHAKGWKLVTKIQKLTEDLEPTSNPHLFINRFNRYFFLEQN